MLEYLCLSSGYGKNYFDFLFKENADKILGLKPKDVKEFGINRMTLLRTKEKIRKGEFDRISEKIKEKIIKQ